MLVALAAILAGTALRAARADDERMSFSGPDTKLANAIVLRRSDFAANRNWSGGPVAPNVPFRPPCAPSVFDPKQSDTVMTGVAEARYELEGISFDNQVQVMKTERMAVLGWKRWAVPGFTRCLESGIRAAGGVPFSVRRVAVPNVGSFAAEYRVLIDFASGNRTAYDLLLISDGRVRLFVVTSASLGPAGQGPKALAEAEAELQAVEVALAEGIAKRVPSHHRVPIA